MPCMFAGEIECLYQHCALGSVSLVYDGYKHSGREIESQQAEAKILTAECCNKSKEY